MEFNRDRFGDGGDDPRFTRGSFDVVDITCNVLPAEGVGDASASAAALQRRAVLHEHDRRPRDAQKHRGVVHVTPTHNFLAHGAVNDWDPVRQGDGAYADANYSAGDVKIGYNQVDLRRPPFCFPEPLVASRPHNGSFEKDPSQRGIVNGLWRLPVLGAFVGNYCVNRQGASTIKGAAPAPLQTAAAANGRAPLAVGGHPSSKAGGSSSSGPVTVHLYFRHIRTSNPKHSEEWYVGQLDTACADLVAAGVSFAVVGSTAWVTSRAKNCAAATRVSEQSLESLPRVREVSRIGHNCMHFKFGTSRVAPMPPGLLRELGLVWVDKLPAICRAAPPEGIAMLADAALPATNPALWKDFVLRPTSELLEDARVNLTRLNTECYDMHAAPVRFGAANPTRSASAGCLAISTCAPPTL